MNRISVGTNDYLDFRATPWDMRSLGLNAIEVMNLRYHDVSGLDSLLDELLHYCSLNTIDLAYLRVDSADFPAKAALQDAGFKFIETSLKVANPKVQKFDFGKIIPSRFCLRSPLESEFPQIRQIAHDAFDFSRFHEDYNISKEAARRRYADWIDDMFAQGKNFLVYEAGGAIKSFLVYDCTAEGTYNLLLAGSERSQGYLSPFFWSSFLTQLKAENAKRIETVVSAANIPVINLYAQFGFCVEQSLFGFHKYFHKPSDI